MIDSWLSILPKGFFGLNQQWEVSNSARKQEVIAPTVCMSKALESGRKRLRGLDDMSVKKHVGNTTPLLVSNRTESPSNSVSETRCKHDETDRPFKRLRFDTSPVTTPPASSNRKHKCWPKNNSSPLDDLPDDVIAHCLSYVGSTEDRFALQTTCKRFLRVSNTDMMMIGIEVGGDRTTGKNGIIRDNDTPDSASDKLAPFAVAGNLEALYM